jgi:hypothetical protein
MATLTIEGRKVKVDDAFLSLSPEEQANTVEEIAASIGVSAPAPESDQSQAVREDLAATSNNFFSGDKDENSALRKADSFIRGAADTASFGMADEIAASAERNSLLNPENYNTPAKALDMVSNLNPITAMVNQVSDIVAPDEQTQSNLRRERAFQTQRDDIDSGASTAGRISGALLGAGALTRASAPFMASLPANATLGAKVAQGAKAGALYSGLYGLGSGEGVQDRVEEGLSQAAIGGAIGGAIPAVAAGVKAVSKPVTDAITGYLRPEAFANKKIAERLANSNLDLGQAVAKMERSPGTTLADVGGKSTRSLLRTATNIPGKAQDFTVSALNRRQLAQGDRIKTIIRETFADPEKFEAAKGRLFQLQAETSQPLYERALSKKNVWNNRLDMFLKDPVTQSGIKQGIRIQRLEALAENKQFNPQDFGITAFNEAGDPIIGGVPNMRTINVIKKGLDAMLEGARHPITGRLTEEGRAIDSVRRAFLNEVDKVNPDYATARKHYANFMQINEAMEFGKEALRMSPASVKARVADMNPMEKIAARVGAAEALRKAVDEVGWTHNAVLKLFNSRQKVQNLQALFNSREEFAEARKLVFAEVRKRMTYDAVKGNSTTAAQMADMMEAGGLKEGVEFAQNAVTSGPVSATLRYVGSRLKMLGGFTPEVAEQVARKLMTSDPATIRKITEELAKIERQNITADQKRQLVQRLITPMLATQVRAASEQ